MDITQSRNAAPKQSALPASSPHFNRILNRLSVRADMMRKGVFQFNDLPTDTIKLIMSRLEPQDIGLGGTNKAHNALVKKALIGSAIEGFVTKHNLTTPKGNPTDPDFLRAAIKEYRYARPISLAMFQELQQTLHVRNGAAQAEAPLFSIEEILTQPQKAAEFTALSGLFTSSREKVQDFQAIATAGGSEKVLVKIQEKGDVPGTLSVKIQVNKDGSNKILTHMRDNPKAWLRLNHAHLYHTNNALKTGGAAAFLKNNMQEWLRLTAEQMQRTIEALNVGDDTATFVNNNRAAWLKLNSVQMYCTKEALNAGDDTAAFVKNNSDAWLRLHCYQMRQTNNALNAGDDTAAFVKNNSDEWLQADSNRMYFTKNMLNAGGDMAEFVKNNKEAWLRLTPSQMGRTTEALNTGGAAEFVKNNSEAWLQLSFSEMSYIVMKHKNPPHSFPIGLYSAE